ncbi:MAG: tRNA epoxyqueuosine(34) reductase QueG [Lachnospirales bacterium]
MHNKLQIIAEKLNIIAGVGKAEPFDIDKKLLSDVPFVGYDVEKRLNPRLTMSDCKSLVAIGIPYNFKYRKIDDDFLRGNISSGAVGEDYHILAIRYLNHIKEELLCDYEVANFADTGPLIDREVAIRCGLGYRGKHFGIINEKIGSMFFIGYALTNVPFEKWNVNNKEVSDNCGECERCIKACPTKAIGIDKFDYKKCISYITQKSGVLSDFEARAIGRQIYGCDICQRACIKNKLINKESEYAYPKIYELLNISNKEFKNIFGKTAAGWRGKKILQRNAIIALGNMKDKKALDILYHFAEDEREEISKSALWAIKEIEKG